MNKRSLLIGIAALAVSLGGVVASEVEISLDKTPAKVRATIEKHAAGAKIQTVEIVTEKGKKVYDVEIRKGGKTIEFSVSPEGKYLGVKTGEDEEKDEAEEQKPEAKKTKTVLEEKAAEKAKKTENREESAASAGAAVLDKAPQAVQATVKKLLGKGKLLELALEGDGNYELDYRVNGIHQAAIISKTGEIQEEEITVAASTLPKAVTEAVNKLYPKAKITLAEKSTTKDGVEYELRVSVGKKSHTITLSPEGKVK
jgi:hypothetical protein